MIDMAEGGIASEPTRAPARRAAPPRGRLFAKYASLFIAVVAVTLVVDGALETWFSYRDHQAVLVAMEDQQAAAGAARIDRFLGDLETELGWTTELPWTAGTLDERRFDALRLLRQVPAITELSQLDPQGKEELRVSRLEIDQVGTGTDYSHDPRFTEAVAHKVWYGPVSFRRQSEPYMEMSLAGERKDAGVSVADVNLKFIWDVVSQLKFGKHGLAYVVDGDGRLIAHPDISLVLRETNLARLPQVAAALKGEQPNQVVDARDLEGRAVLTSFARIEPLGWYLFVELPVSEANAPLYAGIERDAAVLGFCLVLAGLAGLYLARRMVVPIRALGAGAARIGAGDLAQRIEVATGDELEALAQSFNDMAARLQDSYATLERKVEDRTHALSDALDRQTATADILRVIASTPGDPTRALDTIAATAAKLFNASGVMIRRLDGEVLRYAASYGPAAQRVRAAIPEGPPRPDSVPGTAILERRLIVIDNMDRSAAEQFGAAARLAREAGTRHGVAAPLLREGQAIGAIVIHRDQPRPFTDNELTQVKNFADQAVIAIENARLLAELRSRTDELAQSVGELKALGDVIQAVNSTLDLQTVLTTIVANSVTLSETEAGAIYVHDDAAARFELRATCGMDEDLIAALRGQQIGLQILGIAEAAARRTPYQVPDLAAEPPNPVTALILNAGFRALLVVPLLRPDRILGALVVRRRAPGAFAAATIELLETFAAQSVVAIQNARLFAEIEEQGRELAIASQHKSQFLANMSHELRTPLNAILGYTELILDDIYGAAPPKMREVLERVQTNGKHLLGLINDVLDLSKIEAGQLTLARADFSLKDMLQSVYVAVEPLATNKSLAFTLDVPAGLPAIDGDERRLSQVVLNLVGNAIKFTDAGGVTLSAALADGHVKVAVTDTGPGIAQAEQQKIFEEFQQADNTATRAKGGTGLGLAISRRIVEMHRGRLWVESALGAGSTFSFTLPLKGEA